MVIFFFFIIVFHLSSAPSLVLIFIFRHFLRSSRFSLILYFFFASIFAPLHIALDSHSAMFGLREICPSTAVHNSCTLLLEDGPAGEAARSVLLCATDSRVFAYDWSSEDGLVSRGHCLELGSEPLCMLGMAHQFFLVWTKSLEVVIVRYQANIACATCHAAAVPPAQCHWVVVHRNTCPYLEDSTVRTPHSQPLLSLSASRATAMARLYVGQVNTFHLSFPPSFHANHGRQHVHVDGFGGVMRPYDGHVRSSGVRRGESHQDRRARLEEEWSNFLCDVTDEELMTNHNVEELAHHKHLEEQHFSALYADLLTTAQRTMQVPSVMVCTKAIDGVASIAPYANDTFLICTERKMQLAQAITETAKHYVRLSQHHTRCALFESTYYNFTLSSAVAHRDAETAQHLHNEGVVTSATPLVLHVTANMTGQRLRWSTTNGIAAGPFSEEARLIGGVVLVHTKGHSSAGTLFAVLHDGTVTAVPLSVTSTAEPGDEAADDCVGTRWPRVALAGLPAHFYARRIFPLTCDVGAESYPEVTRFAVLSDGVQDLYMVDLAERRVVAAVTGAGAMCGVSPSPCGDLLVLHARGQVRRLTAVKEVDDWHVDLRCRRLGVVQAVFPLPGLAGGAPLHLLVSYTVGTRLFRLLQDDVLEEVGSTASTATTFCPDATTEACCVAAPNTMLAQVTPTGVAYRGQWVPLPPHTLAAVTICGTSVVAAVTTTTGVSVCVLPAEGTSSTETCELPWADGAARCVSCVSALAASRDEVLLLCGFFDGTTEVTRLTVTGGLRVVTRETAASPCASAPLSLLPSPPHEEGAAASPLEVQVVHVGGELSRVEVPAPGAPGGLRWVTTAVPGGQQVFGGGPVLRAAGQRGGGGSYSKVLCGTHALLLGGPHAMDEWVRVLPLRVPAKGASAVQRDGDCAVFVWSDHALGWCVLRRAADDAPLSARTVYVETQRTRLPLPPSTIATKMFRCATANRLLCITERVLPSESPTVRIVALDATTFAVEDAIAVPDASCLCAEQMAAYTSDGETVCVERLLLGLQERGVDNYLQLVLPSLQLCTGRYKTSGPVVAVSTLRGVGADDAVSVVAACGSNLCLFHVEGFTLSLVAEVDCGAPCESVACTGSIVCAGLAGRGHAYFRAEPGALQRLFYEPGAPSLVLSTYEDKLVRLDDYGNLSVMAVRPSTERQKGAAPTAPVVGLHAGYDVTLLYCMRLRARCPMVCSGAVPAAVGAPACAQLRWCGHTAALAPHPNALFFPGLDGSLHMLREMPYVFTYPLSRLEQYITELYQEHMVASRDCAAPAGVRWTAHATSYASQAALRTPAQFLRHQGILDMDRLEEYEVLRGEGQEQDPPLHKWLQGKWKCVSAAAQDLLYEEYTDELTWPDIIAMMHMI